MISRQLTSGMMKRLRQHEAEHTLVNVQARRELSSLRRQEVHQILFENFNRRRQAAVAQQLEIKQHVQFRKLKDQNKVELLRARRHHISAVREFASNAAIHALQYPQLSSQSPSTPSATSKRNTATAFPNIYNNRAQTPTSSSSPSHTQSHSRSSSNYFNYTNTNTSPPSRPISQQHQPQGSTIIAHSTVYHLPPSQATANYEHEQLRLQMDVLKNLTEKVQLQYQSSRTTRSAGNA